MRCDIYIASHHRLEIIFEMIYIYLYIYIYITHDIELYYAYKVTQILYI